MKLWLRCTRTALSLCALFMLVYANPVQAIDTSVWLAGDTSVIKVATSTGQIVLEIPGIGKVESVAVDDDHETVWLLTENRLLLGYSYTGQRKYSILIPGSSSGHDEKHDDHEFEHSDMLVNPATAELWIAGEKTLYKYSHNAIQLLAVPLDHHVEAMTFDAATSTLWIATRKTLRAFGANGQPVGAIVWSKKAGETELLEEGIFKGIEDISFVSRLGVIWVVMKKEILRISRDGTLLQQLTPSIKHPRQVTTDGTGNAWIASKKALQRYSPEGVLQFNVVLPVIKEHVHDVKDHHKEHDAGDNKHIHVRDIVVDLNDASAWILTKKKTLAQVSAQGQVQKMLQLNMKMKTLAINGDLTKPLLSIDSPAKDDLVPPRPEIKLDYSDIGLGTDIRTVALTVNDASVEVTCNGGDGKLTCKADTEQTAYDLKLTLTIKDYAGNISKPATVTVKLDTDGDGHPDDKDTYPEDPDRWRFAPVEGVAPALQEKFVRLEWQAIADVQLLEGYNVYRLPPTGDTAVKLNTELVNAVNYVDETVTNGTGYRYRITAVDNKGVEGEASVLAPFFVAYNYVPVQNIQTARPRIPINISWDAIADAPGVSGFRYQLYRADNTTGTDIPAPLVQVTPNTYEDKTVLWNMGYRYQVATIADFTDVFTQQPVSVIGPRSGVVPVEPLPPLGLELNDVTVGQDGIFEQTVLGQDRLTVTGIYTHALGTVDVKAVSGTTVVNSESSDSTIRLVLPVIADAVWTITVTDRGITPLRDVSTQLRLVKDILPPVITIQDGNEQTIDADNITIQGTVTDDRAGVASLVASSDRFSGVDFGVILEQGDNFSSELPLEAGNNILIIKAVDKAGNESSASVTVLRKVPLAPSLSILSPANGSTVYENRVDVSGTVMSGQEADQLRITLAGRQETAVATASPGVYTFSFNGVRLNEGYNLLVVKAESPAGNTEATTAITYRTTPPAAEEALPPVLDLGTTGLNTTVNDTNVVISGDVTSYGGDVTLTINGETVVITGADGSSGNFEYNLDLSAYPPGPIDVVITVTDSQGNTSTQTLIYNVDITPPAITVTNAGLQAAPTVNRVVESPYQLQGTVSDANLAGFSVNGQSVGLVPGTAGSYSFTAPIDLPEGQQTLVILSAWDLAGNHTSQELVLQKDSPANVELIAPHDGDKILVKGANAGIIVVARVLGLPADGSVTAAADGGTATTLQLDASSATGIVAVAATDGRHSIVVTALDVNGVAIAQARVSVTLENADNIKLKVSKREPQNGAVGVEPNEFIALHFNKPIDPALLQVNVRETAHGKTYDLSLLKGANLNELNNIPLVSVNRDQSPVPGGLALFPGNRMVAFHPERDIAYNASVFVDVIYDGNELDRFSYRVRPLPTFVQGMLSDTLAQPLGGVDISLPDLGRTTTTDSNGNFSFGFGDRAGNVLPGGRHRLVFNPGMKNPRFGTLEKWVTIESGRLGRIGMTLLPILNPDVPFTRLSSGAPQVPVAANSLMLDLSQAQLLFPNGRSSGDAHVQFLSLEQLTFPTLRSVIPAWVYGVQPAGIEVNGTVGLSFKMPPLYGSHAYVPPDGTLVVLVGFDNRAKQINPVGVGRIEQLKVVSTAPVPLTNLDYLGYAIVETVAQPVLKDFSDGKISLVQMISQLEQVAR